MRISFVIPAKNEAAAIGSVVSDLREIYPEAEVIVVDDGSEDNTAKIAEGEGARVVSHPESLGNGAAVKTGARAACGDVFVFMDGDGQHKAAQVEGLLKSIGEGYDLVVGARAREGQASGGRLLANILFNKFAGYMTGKKISDLTSGFRAVRADKFKEFVYLLPNKFSYPTTSTMAFFRAGYSVKYVEVDVEERVGVSHIRPLKDGVRFLLIIFKVATLYSPLKVFFPISLMLFLTGLSYYVVTFISDGRFTNMGMLLLISSLIVFLVGLVSEQISMLTYKK